VKEMARKSKIFERIEEIRDAFRSKSLEEKVHDLWNRGWSRNEIGRILRRSGHRIGHNKIQRIIQRLSKERHEIRKQMRRKRLIEKAKLHVEEKPESTFHEEYAQVNDKSKLLVEQLHDEDVPIKDWIEGSENY
jgi:flagellar motility protein MotE (MotC chaperone)